MRFLLIFNRSMIALILSISASLSIAQSKDEVNQAQLTAIESALNSQQYDKAWAMISEVQERYEGLTQFDFLFARVAIENKEYELAIFALNRVLADEPNNYRVHLEMGRALFFDNHLVQAQNHFNFVLESEPPKTVVDKINQYNLAIENILNQRAVKKFKTLSVIVNATDNVNSAPTSLTLTPENNLLGLTSLSDDSAKRSDQAINVIGTIGIQKPLTNSSQLKTTGTLNIKQGGDSSGINNSVVLSGSATYTKTMNKFTFSPFTQISLNNNDHNFSGLGLILGIQSPYKFTQNLFSSTTFNISANTHDDASIANYNLSFSNMLTYSQKKHTHTLSATVIRFENSNESESHSSFNGANLSYSLNSSISNKFNNTFTTSFMTKLYSSEDPLFLDPDNISEFAIRQDDQFNISNQLVYSRNEKQQYFAKLNAQHQISNIEVYNLTKFDISLGVNFQF